jgi:hypothetical protein
MASGSVGFSCSHGRFLGLRRVVGACEESCRAPGGGDPHEGGFWVARRIVFACRRTVGSIARWTLLSAERLLQACEKTPLRFDARVSAPVTHGYADLRPWSRRHRGDFSWSCVASFHSAWGFQFYLRKRLRKVRSLRQSAGKASVTSANVAHERPGLAVMGIPGSRTRTQEPRGTGTAGKLAGQGTGRLRRREKAVGPEPGLP